jgi:hypothetical protein
MIDRTIYVRVSSAQVFRRLGRLHEIAVGKKGGGSVWPQILVVRLGLVLLGLIKGAFLVKALGGTDDTGLKWRPLSPKTIAYSRRHLGVPPKKRRAKYRPSWMLTRQQRKRWWKLYSHYLAVCRGDKAHAARAAWKISKDEGAQTLIGVYGNAQVDILRDKGLLYNSLSPGVVVGTPPPPLYPPKPKHQVFRTRKGEVIVGTNRLWAWTHHEGTRRIPQRKLWPDPARWTSRWWSRILVQGQLGIVDLVLYLLGKP